MDARRPLPQHCYFVVSDFHLGEGSALPDGRVNELEHFPERNEHLFIEMVEARLAMLPPGTPFTLVFNGDTLDPHAVRYQGRYGTVPTEEAALAKYAVILDGHKVFCGGLRRLMAEHPQLRIIFTDGNHDPELNWASVMELIRAALSPEGQGRRVMFRDEIAVADALISHSDELDALSANPAKDDMFKQDVVVGRTVMLAIAALSFLLMGTVASLTFSWVPYTFVGIAVGALISFAGIFLVLRWIAGRLPFLWSRETTVMNLPLASYMNAGLGMFLKRKFLPDIGRREDHGDEWIVTIANRPYLFPILLPVIFIWAVGHRFYHSFRRPREKFSLKAYFQLIVSTTRPDQIKKEVERFLESRQDVRFYVTGHTHQPMVATYEIGGDVGPPRTVVYLNTGTGIRQIRMVKPPVETRTTWPRAEIFFRRVGYFWKRAPGRAVLSTLAYAVLPAALFLASAWRGWDLDVTRWVVAATALFLLLWWQFAAEYKGKSFTEFTPADLIEEVDGSLQVRLLRYDHDARRFKDFLTGDEIAA